MVSAEDISKGIKFDDEVKLIDTDALKEIEEKTKLDNIEVIEFVSLDDIPFERVTGAYYVQTRAKEGNTRGLKMITHALQKTNTAAIAKWTARTRQKLVAIWARPDGALVMNCLAFRASWLEPDSQALLHLKAEVSDDLLEEAVNTVQEMVGTGEALELAYDERVTLMQDLYDRALAGEAIEVEAPSQVVPAFDESGLMDALKATKKASKAKSKGGSKPKSKAAKEAAGKS